MHEEGKEPAWNSVLRLFAPEIAQACYRGILGRDADPEGLRVYTSILAETKDLVGVLALLVASDEFQRRFFAELAPDIVRALYEGILRREPDETGFANQISRLTHKEKLKSVILGFVTSEEFRQTHGQTIALALSQPDPNLTYEDPCWVYLHIEQAAETSIQNLLTASFPPRSVFAERGDTLYRRSPGDLSRYTGFAGSFNYDSLAYIPRKSISRFTFLREPKERLASLYHYLRAHESGHPTFESHMQAANDLDIEAFHQSDSIKSHPEYWNTMTRAVMGHRQWAAWQTRSIENDGGQFSEQFIESFVRPVIRRRVAEFTFVGFQEDLDRSVATLCSILGIQSPPQVRRDRGLEWLMEHEAGFKRNLEIQPLTDSCVRTLENLCQLDTVLYQEAQALFSGKPARSQPAVPVSSGSAETSSDQTSAFLAQLHLFVTGTPPSSALSSAIASSGKVADGLDAMFRSTRFRKGCIGLLAPEFVRASYRGLLGREPDSKALAALTSKLNEPRGLGAVLSGLIACPEFRQRARSVISPRHPAPCEVVAEKTIFIHIPKTGGTTLHEALLPCFNPREACPERFDDLYRFTAGELAAYRYFSGHFRYVSTELIPGPKRIFTILRHPVKRLVSLYNFKRAHTEEEVRRLGLSMDALARDHTMRGYYSLEEVRRHPSVNNTMVRVLASARDLGTESPSRVVVDAMSLLPGAMENLRSLFTFGILERYEESAKLIFEALGLEPPSKIQARMVLTDLMERHHNIEKVELQDCDEETMEVIAPLVDADLALYRYGLELFEQRLASGPRPDFDGSLSSRPMGDEGILESAVNETE